jgi:hypothetical protein
LRQAEVGDGGEPVVLDANAPVGLVDEAVVGSAEQREVAQVGEPATERIREVTADDRFEQPLQQHGRDRGRALAAARDVVTTRGGADATAVACGIDSRNTSQL